MAFTLDGWAKLCPYLAAEVELVVLALTDLAGYVIRLGLSGDRQNPDQ